MRMTMNDDGQADVAAYVDASATLLALPLDDDRRANVTANMGRIAMFAARLEAVEIGDDVEPAGEFVP